MRDISEHCYRQSNLLALLGYGPTPKCATPVQSDGWLDASNWLRMASSIKSVEAEMDRFTGMTYCSPAAKYDEQWNAAVSAFMTQLSMFNCIWNSFETLVGTVSPPRIPKSLLNAPQQSFVFRIMYYIEQEYQEFSPPQGYEDQLKNVLEYVGYLPDFKIPAIAAFSDEKGLGVNIVRLLRNRFAHGDAGIEKLDQLQQGEFFGYKHLTDLLEMSSRITLLTEQMILIAFFKDSGFNLAMNIDYDPDDDEPQSLEQIAYSVHLFAKSRPTRQLKLI